MLRSGSKEMHAQGLIDLVLTVNAGYLGCGPFMDPRMDGYRDYALDCSTRDRIEITNGVGARKGALNAKALRGKAWFVADLATVETHKT